MEASTEARVAMGSIPGVAPTSIEVATLRKLRTRLLPFLLALYVIAFIDRTNLGFAALTMNRELAISSEQFGLAAGIFFWGYFLLEIPSNLILHRIGARLWIARILITWGAVARVRTVCPSALYRALCSRARRSWILSWYRSVPGLLVSIAGKSTSARADHHRHPRRERPRCSDFRAHPGPCRLARLEQLAMVAHSRGIARNLLRVSDESITAKPTCGSQVSR